MSNQDDVPRMTKKQKLAYIDTLIDDQQWDKCVEMGQDAVAPLADALHSAEAKEPIIEALLQIPGSLESLIPRLDSDALSVKEVDILRMIGLPAQETIIAALDHSSSTVRRRAMGLLGDIGDSVAYDALEAMEQLDLTRKEADLLNQSQLRILFRQARRKGLVE